MCKDHLVNQPTQFGVFSRDVGYYGLDIVIRRAQSMESTSTNIDLAFLYKNEYPILPPLEILTTHFGTKVCGLGEFTYGVF